ncbi:MAG TPA: hypothetical protein VIJ56_06560 [Acidimicrobiales bacterium]
MVWAPIEQWLDRGWSLPRVMWGLVAAVSTVVTAIGYATHPHHPGAVWWVVAGLVLLAIWALSEMLRWRIRHNRMERHLVQSDTPMDFPPIASGFRTPGAFTGIATMSVGVVQPDKRVKQMSHGPIRPWTPTGDLPIAVDTKGVVGTRDGETWVWSADDVVVANETDDHIRCRVWLVADVETALHVDELQRVPNDLVVLEPFGHVQIALEFRLSLTFFDDDAKLDPGQPKELVFLEIGSKGRELRIPFLSPPRVNISVPGPDAG